MRYTAKRKAAIIKNVRDGFVTVAEALADHGISTDEWQSWCRDFDAAGKAGLRATTVLGRNGATTNDAR